MGIEERRHIRIKYPKEGRPNLIAKAPHPIIDISESGCKFQSPNLTTYQVNQDIRGVVQFTTGTSYQFQGKVVRKVADLVMVQFSEPVPRQLLADEVDFLIARFGKFDEAGQY